MSTYSERNGLGEFWQGNEPVVLLAPVQHVEDFVGSHIDQFVTAEQTGAKWTPTITGGASVGVLASASAPAGVAALALANTSEVELAEIDYNDVCNYPLNAGLMFYARIRMATLMTGATGILCIGLQGAKNAAVDSVAESMWFRIDSGAAGLVQVETDDTSNETSKVTTGVTLAATDWADLLIDCSIPSSVKFYINGVQVAAGTTFNMSTVPGYQFQPVVRISKPSEAGVGTVWVDKIATWSARASI